MAKGWGPLLLPDSLMFDLSTLEAEDEERFTPDPRVHSVARRFLCTAAKLLGTFFLGGMAMCCSKRFEHRTGRSVTPPVAPRSAHSIVCCVCGPQVQHRPKAGRRRQSVLERNLAICSGRFARLRLARGGSRERAGVRARGARVARGWRTSFALGFAYPSARRALHDRG